MKKRVVPPPSSVAPPPSIVIFLVINIGALKGIMVFGGQERATVSPLTALTMDWFMAAPLEQSVTVIVAPRTLIGDRGRARRERRRKKEVLDIVERL